MRRAFATALAFALVVPTESAAHRLDEYLQATRVSLARDGISLDVDLTPGANIAPTIVSLLDRDGDRAISPIEAEAYGRVVLADLVLELDGRPIAMTLTRVETPSIGEMRDGLGTIQLRATGRVDGVAAGRRVLSFHNHHQPATSVYLVNALMPEDREVAVVAQLRDPRQSGVRVEYRVSRQWIAQLSWLLLGGVALAGLVMFREVSISVHTGERPIERARIDVV